MPVAPLTLHSGLNIAQGDRPSWALAALRGQRRSAADHGGSDDQQPAFSYDAYIQEDLAPWREHGITEVSRDDCSARR